MSRIDAGVFMKGDRWCPIPPLALREQKIGGVRFFAGVRGRLVFLDENSELDESRSFCLIRFALTIYFTYDIIVITSW